MGNVIKRQDTPDERKAALLDAMIDRELSRPDGEQDPEALAEWNTMIDELTGGAYLPTRAEKRRLVKAMKEHRRTSEGQNHPNAAKKKTHPRSGRRRCGSGRPAPSGGGVGRGDPHRTG